MTKRTKNLIISGIGLLVAVLAFIFVPMIWKEGSLENTLFALLPPLIAIVLALITKEVYSSLFIGILAGGLMYAKFSFTGTMDAIVAEGMVTAIKESAGIFVFLVLLGILVALISKAGASQAFGRWAEKNVKTKAGALLATFALGILIFIDDYFNCLTVGAVMRPVTDRHKISRPKLAYLIDATAAPICMIAPISSWAAAVSKFTEGTGYSGIELFIRAIPYNFYSLLTILFVIGICIIGFDYGKMSEFEIKAKSGDVSKLEGSEDDLSGGNPKGRVFDLIIPIAVLIVLNVLALVYVGGFFGANQFVDSDVNKWNFIQAFSETDATIGLPWGSLITLVFTIIYYAMRGTVSLKESMDAIPKGFIAMVPAILILVLATTLKTVTGLLGANVAVANLMASVPEALAGLFPAIVFLVGCVLSFSTGTSWGTFGILIPITTSMFPPESPLFIICISACLAGAVCGDHCSPISDTTIMSSAGAQCNHVDHVSTQIPYALTVAAVSFVSYIIAGYVKILWISLPVAILLMIGTIIGIKIINKKKSAKKDINEQI